MLLNCFTSLIGTTKYIAETKKKKKNDGTIFKKMLNYKKTLALTLEMPML